MESPQGRWEHTQDTGQLAGSESGPSGHDQGPHPSIPVRRKCLVARRGPGSSRHSDTGRPDHDRDQDSRESTCKGMVASQPATAYANNRHPIGNLQMHRASAMRTLYDVLGLSHGATYREVRDAYHCKLNAHHGDYVEHLSGTTRAATEREVKWIQRAWDILGSPSSRQHYDRQLINLFLHVAETQTRAIPSSIFTQTTRSPSFTCANCEHHVEGKTLTKCPRCGQPAKASWVPRNKVIRSLGLVPASVALADAVSRQPGRLKRALSVIGQGVTSTTFVMFLVVAVFLCLSIGMCVSEWRRENADPWSAYGYQGPSPGHVPSPQPDRRQASALTTIT